MGFIGLIEFIEFYRINRHSPDFFFGDHYYRIIQKNPIESFCLLEVRINKRTYCQAEDKRSVEFVLQQQTKVFLCISKSVGACTAPEGAGGRRCHMEVFDL